MHPDISAAVETVVAEPASGVPVRRRSPTPAGIGYRKLEDYGARYASDRLTIGPTRYIKQGPAMTRDPRYNILFEPRKARPWRTFLAP
jgi:hypothetical protein